MGRKKKLVSVRSFSNSTRIKIIEEYLNSRCTKQYIWEKYTGQKEEHGRIIRWMREYGYLDDGTKSANKHPSKRSIMSKKKQVISDEKYETMQLRKRISDLEKQLKDAELKAIAFSIMVDIAEQEFKIPIRKKLNTKPSNE